jgi:TPR repeat protein
MKKLIILFFLLPATCVASIGEVVEANIAAENGDYKTALQILSPLAKGGDVYALESIGRIYAYGDPTHRDIEKAYSYWVQAAEKECPIAMFHIANVHLRGDGKYEKDVSKAVSWYIKAAQHRHFLSAINLSSLYSGGKGIEQDKSKSLAWAVVADVLADSKEDADISYQQMHKLLPLMNPNPEDVSKAKKLALELLDSLKPKSGD